MIGGTRVDYWRDTLTERAFVGSGFQDQVAGEFSGVQLWNPAASGKQVICTDISLYQTAAREIRLYMDNAALTTPGFEINKRIGAGMTASVAQIFYDSDAARATFGTIISGQLAILYQYIMLNKNQDPFIINEGYGLTVMGDTINESIRAQFHWIEV